MSWVSGITLYIVIWWIALFIVLPIGTKPVAEADQTSGWRGAPERPELGRKILMTSVLAAILWGVWYLVLASELLSFRSGWLAMPSR